MASLEEIMPEQRISQLTIDRPGPAEYSAPRAASSGISIDLRDRTSARVARPHRSRPRPRLRSAWLIGAVDLATLMAPAVVVRDQNRWLALGALVAMTLLAMAELYRPRLQLSMLDDLPDLLGRSVVAVGLVATASVIFDGGAGRSYVVAGLVAAAVLPLTRALSYALVRSLRRRGLQSSRTLFLGAGEIAAEIATLLAHHKEHGLTPVGYVDDMAAHTESAELGPWYGEVSQLQEAIREAQADVVLVAFGRGHDNDIVEVLRAGSEACREVYVVPRLFEVLGLRGVPDHVGAIPVVRLRRPRHSGLALGLKRAVDIVVSGGAIIVLAPVLIACAIAVRTTGPQIIFRQRRIGKGGQPFELLKFRSMQPVDPSVSATTWSALKDPRMTTVGSFLRKTSLDELPQLWNILCGQMTLVGPRPERPVFVEQFSQQFSHYPHRHRVAVGLTGLAQISGLRGGESSIERRARYDNYYIENWSLWGDVKVMLRTVSEVVHGKGG